MESFNKMIKDEVSVKTNQLNISIWEKTMTNLNKQLCQKKDKYEQMILPREQNASHPLQRVECQSG